MADIPMNELINDLLDVLIKHNIIDKYSVRNFLIRKRYSELYQNQKMKSKDARRLIANEFNLSEKTIEYIIYLQKRN
ncbi:MAG: hypothetical protein AB1521_16180 [Bacteroidota bacterium]